MIPPVFYHVLTTQHPLTPVSLWDSRPCRADPGALTCDDILPAAPDDFQAISHGKIPGSGACLDQNAHQYQAPIADPHGTHQHFGITTLWWLPACQSVFAVVAPLIDGYVGTTAQIVVSLPGNRWTNEVRRQTVTMAQGIMYAEAGLVTTLVWRYPGAQIAACGAINDGHSTYSTCTPFYNFG